MFDQHAGETDSFHIQHIKVDRLQRQTTSVYQLHREDMDKRILLQTRTTSRDSTTTSTKDSKILSIVQGFSDSFAKGDRKHPGPT